MEAAAVNLAAAPVSVAETLGAGEGRLAVQVVAGESAATQVHARSPLKLLVPKPRGPSVWAFTSGLGGGYVAGDETRLEVCVGAGARCFLGTQASTKIYRNPDARPCRHELRATIGADALLVLAPDPVQCFAEARYEQRQQIHLAPGAGLVLVDGLSSGRAARGERWDFARYRSRLDVFENDERVLLDSLCLDPRDGVLAEPARLGRFNCLALVLLLGEPLRPAARQLLAAVAVEPVSRRAELVCAASPVNGGALLRLAGTSVEPVSRAVRQHLGFVTALLGDDPWARKW